MKRRLYSAVLPAGVMASCVSCSRSGHLYYVSFAGQPSRTYDHQWSGFKDSCIITQYRVPLDAYGKETTAWESLSRWRTSTDVYVLGHSIEFYAPAWAVALIGISLFAAISGAALLLTSRISNKLFRSDGIHQL